MRYLGGKAKIAKEIAPIILQNRPKIVVEPFCGALNVTAAMLELDPKLQVYCSDYNKDLIDMWQAIKSGEFDPAFKEFVSEEEYRALKKAPPSPFRTFVGHACSFGGKGKVFARDSKETNYYQAAVNSTLRKIKHINRMHFSHKPYWDLVIPKESTIYCDPPYLGTYHQTSWDKFDHDRFFDWASTQENECYISELKTPFKCVWEKQVNQDMGKKGKRVERLFKVK